MIRHCGAFARGNGSVDCERETECLYAEIGQLIVKRDFLAKRSEKERPDRRQCCSTPWIRIPHCGTAGALAHVATADCPEPSDVTTQNGLQILVDDEPRPDQTRIAEHH